MVPGWSDNASAIWGKTGADGAWLPLVVHLDDTAAVGELLWDRWLPRIVRARVAAALGGSEDLARALYVWLASLHDIAKACPAFAGKARRPDCEHLIDRLERHGLRCPVVPRDDYAHHGVMGQVLVEEWLTAEPTATQRQSRSLAVAVGGHHGVPPTSSLLKSVKANRRPRRGSLAWGGPAWDEVRREILHRAADRSGLDRFIAALGPDGLPVTVQADLSAALIVADWLASDEKRFPYDSLDDPEGRRDRALATISLPPPWAPPRIDVGDLPQVFTTRFPHLAGRAMRPLQVATAEMSAAVEESPLLVIEAPMGAGKTEAALVAAEILAERFGCGGMFVALPTMATSDAMFARVLSWLRQLPGDDEASVFLAHSKAGLNSDFEGLVRDSRARFVEVYDDEADTGRIAPVVDSWLRGRKRGVLADHVIGTIDQVLFGALQSKHLALRHLALSGKVVIVDEVHAADDFMRVYLELVLEWLGAYGTPVVLLSATLPPAQRASLVSAYRRGRLGLTDTAAQTPAIAPPSYPSITAVTRGVMAVAVEPDDRATDVKIELLPDGCVRELLGRELKDGGCVAVIRDTVARAQATYDELRRDLGDDVVLVHSRFIGPDRMRIEADLRERLGPPGSEALRPKRLIVVGTQVLEQSLDIDFDLMISDIAPLDLVLQRVGRLHRHARPASQRPPRMRRPRLYLDGVHRDDASEGPPTFDPGCVGVYGDYRLLRSMEALRTQLDSAATLTLPRDIPLLVTAAYDDGIAPPLGWVQRWTEARAAHDAAVASQRERARAFRLGPPERPNLVDWLTSPVKAESDDAERTGRAQVRDTEDSLEVVLAYRGDDGLLHVMPGVPEHADAAIPTVIGRRDEEVARAAATCTVRLPRLLTHPGVLDAVIGDLEARPEVAGWQESRWLRGQLALPLDGGLRTRLLGHVIHYDRRLGLVLEPEKARQENA